MKENEKGERGTRSSLKGVVAVGLADCDEPLFQVHWNINDKRTSKSFKERGIHILNQLQANKIHFQYYVAWTPPKMLSHPCRIGFGGSSSKL